MYDLNYFSVLAKEKQKNAVWKKLAIGILLFLLLVNAAIITFAYTTFTDLEARIATNEAYLNSAEVQARVKQVELLNKENTIAEKYLAALTDSAARINSADLIKVELLDYIRELAPANTYFRRTEYDQTSIEIDCFSTEVTDPMNFYHRLLNEEMFSQVVMPGFNVGEDGLVVYSVILQLKGEGEA